MTTQHGTHNDLHSAQGARRGEHPGRARNPIVKVHDLAWLEVTKPDLAASDPDGLMVEHFADGDVFDCTLEPGWSPLTASGLAQWGPAATKDFLGLTPGRVLGELASLGRALREDNEFDLDRLRGYVKVAGS